MKYTENNPLENKLTSSTLDGTVCFCFFYAGMFGVDSL